MNPISPHPDWLSLAGMIALEVVIMVGAAAALRGLTRAPMWRRTIWHICLLGLTGLVVFELTGVARGLAGWVGIKLHAQPSKSNLAHIASSGSAFETLRLNDNFRRQVGGRIEANQPTHIAESSRPEAPTQAPVASVVAQATPLPDEWQQSETRDPQLAQIENRAGRQGNHGWIGAVWLLGAAVVLFRVVLGRLLFIAFRWRRQTECDGPMRDRVQELARQIGIQRRVRLLELSKLPGPIAFGILRPTIGLPPTFRRNFSVLQQDAMIAHELAHLAVHDPAWGILADAVVAALWWHPLVWWARRQLCAANEAAADEASLLIADGPNVLAECLVELGNRLSRPQSFGWLAIGGNGYRSALGDRVQRLLRLTGRSWQPPSRLRSGVAKTIGPVALLTAAVLCTAGTHSTLLNEGDTPMKLIDQNWKKSVLAFALAATLAPDTRAALANKQETSAETTVAKETSQDPAVSSPGQLDPRLARRYGLRESDKNRPSRRAVESKLEQIAFNESTPFNGLALSEVVKYLDDETRRRDPEKRGINFIISNSPKASSGAIDPLTGQPIPAAQSDPVDLNDVIIKLNALRHVRLRDVLDALTKVAGQPIQFSVEDYGVVFSRRNSSPVSVASTEETPKMFWDLRMAERYGLKLPTTNFPATGSAPSEKGRHAVQVSLEQITFDELQRFDGIPLGEAIRDLDAEVRKRDPEKHGINFILSNSLDAPQPSSSIDPNTGLPVPVEPVDVSSVTIRLAALRHVRLKDVLDAITKVADHPIKYTVEEYGVVLSRKVLSPDMGPAQLAPPAPLQVRTYHVDTNTFLKGLESAFGITVSNLTSKSTAVRRLFQQLGVNMDAPGKTVFYNDLTGVLMVRATKEDLEIVQAAIETLGGRAAAQRRTVSILGCVNQQGVIELPEEKVSGVLDAIARAGGVTRIAKETDVRVTRLGEPKPFCFDLRKLREETDSEKLFALEPGDTIFVPESVF